MFIWPLVGMEQTLMSPQVSTLSLNLNERHEFKLDSVLNHISNCRKSGNSIEGFHFYGERAHTIEKFDTGFLIKINPFLWVYTHQNPEECHVGYVIYKGQSYAKPKTFFPRSWKTKELMNHLFSQQSTLRHKDTTFRNKNCIQYELNNPAESLKVIIESLNGKYRLLTLYPLVQNNVPANLQHILDSLAHKQRLSNLSNTAVAKNPPQNADKKKQFKMVASNLDKLAALFETYEDITTPDNNGDTILHYAAEIGDDNLLVMCLETSILNHKNSVGRTPLMIAVENNKPDCVRTLLGYGADPDCQDNSGNTALHHAVTKNTCVPELLTALASTDIHNKRGKSPLDLAKALNNCTETYFLEEEQRRQEWINTYNASDFLYACYQGNYKIASKQIATDKTKVHEVNDYGYSPLYCACESKNEELVSLLLDQGADPRIQLPILPHDLPISLQKKIEIAQEKLEEEELRAKKLRKKKNGLKNKKRN